MAFGVYTLVRRQIIRKGPRTLPRLAPMGSFWDLAPFLGVHRATEVANADAPPAVRLTGAQWVCRELARSRASGSVTITLCARCGP